MTTTTKHTPTINESLKRFNFLFKSSGLEIANKSKYSSVYMFNLAWLVLAIAGTLEWLLEGIITGKSFVELSYVTPCLTFSVLGNIKSILFKMHESDVNVLVDHLMKLESQEGTSTNSERAFKIKAAEIKLFNHVTNWLCVLNVLMILFFDLGPLVIIGLVYFQTGEVNLELPFLNVYPFDALDIRYWPFAYIHQVWSVCIVLLSVGSVDCFLFTCCTYIRIQFELIKIDIETIVPNMHKTADRFRGLQNFDTKFRDIIVRHQEVIRIANLLETINSKSTLLNFITSSIVICFTGFNVTIQENFTAVLKFSIFLFMSLLQVLSLCYFGDSLMRSSTDVSEAVYASRWYLADINIARKLLFIQTRAQYPCKLTAAKFADVNLRSFMKVISTAWSYFALLKTIYTR